MPEFAESGRYQRTAALFDGDSEAGADLFGNSDDDFFDGEFDEMERNVRIHSFLQPLDRQLVPPT